MFHSAAAVCSGLRKRCQGELLGAVDNHPRLRVREDGEKPSPPRDCKAKVLSAQVTDQASWRNLLGGLDGKAAPPPFFTGGNSPSQETGGVSIRIRTHIVPSRTTFNSRARGRGG